MDNPETLADYGSAQLGNDYQDMLVRDFFAGQALAGLCANSELLRKMPPSARAFRTNLPDDIITLFAKMAYGYADTMLAARSPSSEGGES